MRGGHVGAVLGWTAIAAVVGAGCAQVLGIDDWQDPAPGSTSTSSGGGDATTTTTGSSNGGGGGGADGCQCLPMDVPAGWTGPVMFHSEAAGAALTCPSGWSELESGHSGLSSSPAVCGGCQCTTLANVCSGLRTLIAYDQPGCTGAEITNQGNGGTCLQFLNPLTNVASLKGLAPAPVPDACTASGGALVDKPAPTWGQDAHLCAPPAEGGCVEPARCAPAAPGYELCIFADGDVACPVGSKTVLYRAVDDTRGCNACGCSTGSITCSPPTASLYTDNLCTNEVATVTYDGGCLTLSPAVPSIVRYSLSASGTNGMCTPTGGAPTGAATPASPVTACCFP